MTRTYRDDLAFIHDAGFVSYAERAADVVIAALRRAGVRRGLVVDLGCGSGVLAARLTAAGYDVLGIDLSASMIEIARRRAPRARFQVGSWLDAKIPPCVAVTAVGEVVNYTFDRRHSGARVAALFRRVFAALSVRGLLVLDALSPGHVAGSGTRVGHRQGRDWAVLVTVVEDRSKKTLTRDITTFRRVGARWRRSHEVHRHRLIPSASLHSWLRSAGFRVRTLRGYGPLRFGRGHAGFIGERRPGRFSGG